MFDSRTLLLALLLTACGQAGSSPAKQHDATQNGGASFLKLAKDDPWAKWPEGLQKDPADDGQPGERVSEQSREEAIALLGEAPAVALSADEYERLTGVAPSATDDTFNLLRGFSTTNSTARVKTTGDAVAVIATHLAANTTFVATHALLRSKAPHPMSTRSLDTTSS